MIILSSERILLDVVRVTGRPKEDAEKLLFFIYYDPNRLDRPLSLYAFDWAAVVVGQFSKTERKGHTVVLLTYSTSNK